MGNRERSSTDDRPITVLIAGVGGGSLGLEVLKCLRPLEIYRLIGTDVSEKAYGLYAEGFDRTHVLRAASGLDYAMQLLEVCRSENVDAVAPGAEEVHRILAENRELFSRHDILLMLNSPGVIDACSDKCRTMALLKSIGIPVPETTYVASDVDLAAFSSYPCIVKPAVASGGSNLVFIAEDREEAALFSAYLQRRGLQAMLQQYIVSNAEFTVGVLSSPDGELLSSVSLQRSLDSKLSTSLRYADRVVSSGWSQGRIDEFVEVCKQAERIALALDSRWALNVQGRMGLDGIFYPFEINPRHSGTTYLRAMAGINEPHILLQYCLRGRDISGNKVSAGYYLRSFTEKYVKFDELIAHD